MNQAPKHSGSPVGTLLTKRWVLVALGALAVIVIALLAVYGGGSGGGGGGGY